MNLLDILIVILIVLIVAGGVIRIRKNKKRGCSCGCAGCQACCDKDKCAHKETKGGET